MGTWGPGNLENDYAAEELSDRCNTLLKALLERAALKESREGDEYHYTTLYVDFEILFALARAGLWSPTSMPTPGEIKALRNDYLKDWDKHMSDWSAEKGGGPAEPFISKRRVIIRRCFNRLGTLSAQWHAHHS